MSAFDDLMGFVRQTEALAQISERLGWDQEVMMPRAAAPQRAEESAALEAVLHARRTDPRLGDWLERAEAPDEAGAAQLRHIRRSYERACRVPADLAERLAHVTSLSQGIWAEARAAEDVAAFLPSLTEVVALKREEAAALAQGGDLYDALLDDYEPGASSQALAEMFDALRPGLVSLRDAVLDKEPVPALDGHFETAAQHALGAEVAQSFGYDLAHGRIDTAVHPFASGSGLDVRITTRTAPDDPFNCLYSVIHETGHACYEQGIDRDYLLTPLGHGVSMGVHESQSRLYENQLGRSRAFCGYLHARMEAHFGPLGVDRDGLWRAANRVTPGYIRTESDEVQYNLHVLLRFDLERALMRGDLEVVDLEAAWNERFAHDFGVAVDRPSNGVLQDVHWSVGLFGYFPTYTLGNVYAGCLFKALKGDVEALDADLERGDTRAATAWLRDRVHRPGGLCPPRETVERACGFDVSEAPLLEYLNEKFSALYDL